MTPRAGMYIFISNCRHILISLLQDCCYSYITGYWGEGVSLELSFFDTFHKHYIHFKKQSTHTHTDPPPTAGVLKVAIPVKRLQCNPMTWHQQGTREYFQLPDLMSSVCINGIVLRDSPCLGSGSARNWRQWRSEGCPPAASPQRKYTLLQGSGCIKGWCAEFLTARREVGWGKRCFMLPLSCWL